MTPARATTEAGRKIFLIATEESGDRLGAALSIERPDREFAYLPAAEKQNIRAILKATLPDLPSAW